MARNQQTCISMMRLEIVKSRNAYKPHGSGVMHPKDYVCPWFNETSSESPDTLEQVKQQIKELEVDCLTDGISALDKTQKKQRLLKGEEK